LAGSGVAQTLRFQRRVRRSQRVRQATRSLTMIKTTDPWRVRARQARSMECYLGETLAAFNAVHS
jgi:hypothetical protein